MNQAQQISQGRMPAQIKVLADKLATSKIEFWGGYETRYTFADGSGLRLLMPS